MSTRRSLLVDHGVSAFFGVSSFAGDDSSCYTDDDRAETGSNMSALLREEQEEERRELKLVAKETVQVFRLRLLVFLALLLAAVAVSLIVYFLTIEAETMEASSQFDGAANKVLDAFINIVDSKLRAIASLGVASIAHNVDQVALSTNPNARLASAWPFVTLSSFQQRAATVLSESGALLVHINPVVTGSDRKRWERYVAGNASYWIDEANDYQQTVGLFNFLDDSYKTTESSAPLDGAKTIPIWYRDSNNDRVQEASKGLYLPVWQTSPYFADYLGDPVNENSIHYNRTVRPTDSFIREAVVISEFVFGPPGGVDSEHPLTSSFALMQSTAQQQIVEYRGDPMSQVYFPVFDSFERNRLSVAVLIAWINWGSYFNYVLPTSLVGVYAVLSDSCGGVYTFMINGEQADPIGPGDLHDPQYSYMKLSASLESVSNIADGSKYGLPLYHDRCKITLDVYPSSDFYALFNSNTPVVVTTSVAIIFVFTAVLFVFYDCLVERRQKLILRKAEQTTAIVSSLFPESVRDRVIQAETSERNNDHSGEAYLSGFASNLMPLAPNSRLKSFLADSVPTTGGKEDISEVPIADLYPDCTVLFADIAGFTAWSSAREPAQVFTLLQTVYQAFDTIAKRRRVFKVETIGDSYLAVTGLPDPQPTHAVIMARFAGECLDKMHVLTAELETSLGPDTCDLTMRFGMHSGPVTAGVLKGDRARFQLFGDTVNTASRMESNGVKGKIQVSMSTRDQLVEAGKEHWLQPRPDQVKAKGKGYLQTFWLNPNLKQNGTSTSRSVVSDTSAVEIPEHIVKHDRLVDWMVEMLQVHIQKLLARRKGSEVLAGAKSERMLKPKSIPLHEMTEMILLPKYDPKATASEIDYRLVEVNKTVLSQLRSFISVIASTYHTNAFHNFEHACHVTMAANKFIKRIVAPDIAHKLSQRGDIGSKLHDYTLGINSDPLTVLAILISALIHDADHQGVGNPQLKIENSDLAASYENKAIAEQNSVDIAWNLLMSDEYERLRACLFVDDDALRRFRQVMVNVVLATDIFDKEMNDRRKARWSKAFDDEETVSMEDKQDLRATIVIEYIMQASDVSHTMQHWHVYRKWNERLFRELYLAYKAGRMETDPSSFWYQGEINFFDNYVIPLAKKLKECNVFGVSSDECVTYAMQNRTEWADRGREVLSEMMMNLSPPDPETTPELRKSFRSTDSLNNSTTH